MHKVILFFLLILSAPQCKKQEAVKLAEKPPEKLPHFHFEGENPQILVESHGGLKLREKPDLNSKTLTVIPNGSFVSFLEDTDLEIEAESKKGKFFKIQYMDYIGYSFSGLLNFRNSAAGEIFGYYEVTSNIGNRYTYKGFTSDKAFIEAHKTRQMDQNREPSRCNGKYVSGSYQCIYSIFTNEGRFVMTFKVSGGYEWEWQEWISDTEIQADASFTDAGCDITRKAVFSVTSMSYRNIVNESDCSAYESMKKTSR